MEKKKVSKIWDGENDVLETYRKWEKTVMETRVENETIRRTTDKRRSKTMRLLMKEKKR